MIDLIHIEFVRIKDKLLILTRKFKIIYFMKEVFNDLLSCNNIANKMHLLAKLMFVKTKKTMSSFINDKC